MQNETDSIRFEILGHHFEASALHGAKGGVWWALCDEAGDRSGMEISPLGSGLPAVLTVNGEEYEFQPVPKRGSTTEFRPFKKTRQLRCETSFGSHRINIHCRLTSKRNKMWNLWFLATRVAGTGNSPEAAAPDPPRDGGLKITVREVNPEQN